MSSIGTTYDPDREREPREVQEGRQWAYLREHSEPTPEETAAWRRRCYDHAMEADRIDGTHLADLAYPEFAAPVRGWPEWVLEDEAIHDRDEWRHPFDWMDES